MTGTKFASYEQRRLLAPIPRARRGVLTLREVRFDDPAEVLGDSGGARAAEAGIDQLEVRQKTSRLMP